MGKKRVGSGRKSNTPWKAQAQEIRRKAAEERQRKYDSIPMQDKIRQAGAKQKAKLLAKAGA